MNCWKINDVLTLCSIILATIGGGFALFKWTSSLKIKRAEFVEKIINKIRFNDEMQKIMYLIDYNGEWYSNKFHKSEMEKSIDKLFSYFDYVCYLYKRKIINANDFKIPRYEIHRVCTSISSRAYLWNIYHFSKKINVECSFQNLIDYAIKNRLMDKCFKKNNTDLYLKCLNF
jgi:tagatose-1,6-bisphosphate aldolase non-catalytic subunit AgaZ/GatZ